MSQNQATAEYPYPSEFIAPPAGYPTIDDQSDQQNPIPVKTISTGWCCCLKFKL